MGRDPTVGGRGDDGVDGDHHRHGDQDGPEPVDALLDAQPDVVHQEEVAGGRRGDADRHVHEEDPVPAEELGQDAPGQEPDRAAADGDEDVGAHGLGPLEGVGKLGDDDGHDDRGGERAADALDEAGDHEHALVLGCTADDGGHGEEADAGEEHLLAADEVTQAAGQEEEAAEGDEVGVDDPGQAGLGEVEALLYVGQGHVHDGAVEGVHEHGQADDDQGYPAAAVGLLVDPEVGDGTGRGDSHDFGTIIEV